MAANSETPGFYPLRLNRLLVRFCQAIALPAAHWFYRIELEIDPADLERLQALRGTRRLLLPNHPTFQDPVVVFLLSAKLHQTFYFLAAYESFKGFLAKFLPRVGVYSIRRGIADRTSIAYTLDLISQPECCLVIFPEGGCSFQNDTVMPFRVGGVQLAFQVLNRFAKRDEAIPDFYAVPISIKYRYKQDMTTAIEASLSQLETKLGLTATGDDYERLRAIAQQVLINLEQEYGLNSPTLNQSWDDRIAALKTHVLQECEQHLSINPSPSEPIRERVYRIQYAMQTNDELLADPDDPNLSATRFWTIEAMQKATFRLLNFDAIQDGYVAENPTPERFLDTLTRLEREVFNIDQPPPKGDRVARVKIGEPMNLKDFFAAYQQNRNSTISRVVSAAQQTVQRGLDQLSAEF